MAAPSLTLAAGLASALETSARAAHLRHKPLHTAAGAAQLAQQLHKTVCMERDHVLQLLLSHPAVLWQHKTPNMPTQLMSDLQQLLPGLLEDRRLPQLLRKKHRLLSCSTDDLSALVNLLSTRLQASQDQAAQMVMQHPALLVTPVKQMLPNIGFLVGLGLTPSDLKAMALRSPKWLTVSLHDLTVQWQFVQQLLKVSVESSYVVDVSQTQPSVSQTLSKAMIVEVIGWPWCGVSLLGMCLLPLLVLCCAALPVGLGPCIYFNQCSVFMPCSS